MAILRAEAQLQSWEGTFGIKGEREISFRWRVVSDNINDGPWIVRATNLIPDIYDTYSLGGESDTGLYVSSKKVSGGEWLRGAAGREIHWFVDVKWTRLDRDEYDLPGDRETIIHGHMEHFERIAEVDVDGNGVLNSAGQYFDPPIQADDSRPVITMIRNEPDFPYLTMLNYHDRVNNATWNGIPAQCVKIFNISAQEKIEHIGDEGSEIEFKYWEVTYEFHVNYDGWRKQILDQGRYELNSGGTALVAIEDSEGRPVNDPVLLDGAGNGRPEGPPVYLTYQVYYEVSFAPLSLP